MSEPVWGSRDAQGEWQPDELPQPSPLFTKPFRPRAILAYLFAPGGFFFPFNLLILGLAVVSGLYFTPATAQTVRFAWDWIAGIYLRNAVLMVLVFGSFHYWLYIRKAQGTKYKYQAKWLAKNDKRFWFRNQTWDNIFFSLVSGCTIWTGYEALTLWAFANGLIPWTVDWARQPVYSTLLLLAVPFIREIHFYWVHRFTHWKLIFKPVHALHHRNVNVGPWSGMSMNAYEHILYLSGVILHWVIPSHPIHAIAHLMHAGLSPVKGHSGFNKFMVAGFKDPSNEKTIRAGNYLHYLHHRFFTVNYGNDIFPFDRWYGSFHDGSAEMHQAMMERRRKEREKDLRKSDDEAGELG